MGLPQVFFLKKHKHILKLQGYIFILCEIAICWSLLFEERCAPQQSWCISWNINSIEGEGRGQYTWDFCLKWKEFKLFTKWHPGHSVNLFFWQHWPQMWRGLYGSIFCDVQALNLSFVSKGFLLLKGASGKLLYIFLCSVRVIIRTLH